MPSTTPPLLAFDPGPGGGSRPRRASVRTGCLGLVERRVEVPLISVLSTLVNYVLRTSRIWAEKTNHRPDSPVVSGDSGIL